MIAATLALGRAIAIYSGLTLAIGPGNAPQQSDVVQRGTVQLRCEHAEIGAVADRSRNGSVKSRRRAAILSHHYPGYDYHPYPGYTYPAPSYSCGWPYLYPAPTYRPAPAYSDSYVAARPYSDSAGPRASGHIGY